MLGEGRIGMVRYLGNQQRHLITTNRRGTSRRAPRFHRASHATLRFPAIDRAVRDTKNAGNFTCRGSRTTSLEHAFTEITGVCAGHTLK